MTNMAVDAEKAEAIPTITAPLPSISPSDSSAKDEGPPEVTKAEWNTRSSLTVVGSFLSSFCTTGFSNAFGVFQEYYHDHELSSYSESDISWIGSFTLFGMFIFILVAGALSDKVNTQILLLIGSVGILLSVFMLSLCTEYYQFFLAQGVLLGPSMAFIMSGPITNVSRHFSKHRGLAMGVTIAGSSIGGVVWPIMLDELLNTRGMSFGWTLRIVGFTMLPLLAAVSLFVRPPVGFQASTKKGLDKSILKQPAFLTLCGALAIYYLGFFTPFFYVSSYAVDLGKDYSFSFHLISILNGASFFGRITGGFSGDRLGMFNTSILAAFLSAIICYCWTAVKSDAGLIVWSLAYGYASGAIMNLQIACAAQLATPQTLGIAMGMVMGSVSLTGLVGTPISGQLVQHGWIALSTFAASSMAVGTILLTLARLQQNRKVVAKV